MHSRFFVLAPVFARSLNRHLGCFLDDLPDEKRGLLAV